MPQLFLYLDEESMANLKANATREQVSLSKYTSKILKEHSYSHGWPENYWDLFGTIEDASFTAPAELNMSLDRAREW